jgi:cytosine/uracil/thiamine/allantoin permease
MLPALGLTAGPAHPLFAVLYDGAWFVGALVSTAVYCALSWRARAAAGGSSSGGGSMPAPA